jgi:ribose 1,5-bisphosphokinase
VSPEREAGAFVAVVGPSGAGKDTLMARAAADPALDRRVVFARRVVTRAAQADAEDHDSLDEAGFARAEAQGAFALVWSAHGLRYGLPSRLRDALREGRTVVANLSRRSLAEAAEAFGSLQVVEVTASPEILLARLVARGREDEPTIRDRLARQVPMTLPPGAGHRLIDNSGCVETATRCLVDYLNGLGGVR